MNEEIWKVVEGFPQYSVSNTGKLVRNGNGGRFRPSSKPLGKIGRNGYILVSLHAFGTQKSRTLHSIVCETFHGPRPSANHQVAHGDGDRTNCAASNLRWATRAENMADCVLHGTRRTGDDHHSRIRPERLARGERNGGGGKLTEDAVRSILRDERSNAQIAADHGVVKSMIGMIKRRTVWKHVQLEGAL